MERAKATARRDEKHLGFKIWCTYRFDGIRYMKREYSIKYHDNITISVFLVVYCVCVWWWWWWWWWWWGDPLVTSGFPSQRARNVEFWCMFPILLAWEKLLNKQSSWQWFETPCDVTMMHSQFSCALVLFWLQHTVISLLEVLYLIEVPPIGTASWSTYWWFGEDTSCVA